MISLVIPCYNEQEVLPALYSRLTTAAATWDTPYEVIVIDDGSHDESWNILNTFRETDNRWKILRFSRNFGHQTAISAGIWHASGDCVIIMDADLQDPPEFLEQMIAQWKSGYEVVYAIREKRKENIIKRFSYSAFYRILARIANINIPLDSGDFCLLDRKVVDVMNSMPEKNRFVRGLRSWIGFRQIGVTYERDARAAGTVKYTVPKLMRLALDGIFSFSTTPLKLSTYLGFLSSLFALIGIIHTLFQRLWLSREEFAQLRGYSTILITILFLGGVQLISIGIIGEYLGRIFDEVKSRPTWIIRDAIGFETDSAPTVPPPPEST
jgi:glycosyltransferase involved in cell wall biosynthesis